ncbi:MULTISPECIES: DUF5794 domain-containing protein [unclassified Haladaptatus]|uniref:DUF5794 domain-containing protein n=1 Tax=unclassified Haladaptatus TaxID=2622732 RepID=UPI0023E7CAE4|nr:MULTISPECIES: DUF5794 domain-containing protein [unclassified Haladaptatus]
MSSSQHPIALRLERQVGGAAKLLVTVMALPLIDGIFPALVLAGALDSVTGILEVGLLVFGGSATVAVILAEMDGTPREQAQTILIVGIPLIALAALEAALAPTIKSVLMLDTFERFAALVILAIAAKTASATIGEYLPRPGVIIGLGLLASLDVSGFEFALALNPDLIVRAAAAAGVGVGFALSIALLGPWLRGVVDIDRFRFGSAVALGMLPLSILHVPGVPSDAPIALAVLGIATILAFDPDNATIPKRTKTTAPPETEPEPAPEPTATRPQPVHSQAVTDGGDDEDDSGAYGYPGESENRAPWL